MMGSDIPGSGRGKIPPIQIPLQPLLKSLPGLLNLPLEQQAAGALAQLLHHGLLLGLELRGSLRRNKCPLQLLEPSFVIPDKRIQRTLPQTPVAIVKRRLVPAGKPQALGHIIFKLASQPSQLAIQPRLLAKILHALELTGNIGNKLLGILQCPLNRLGRNILHRNGRRNVRRSGHPGSSIHRLLQITHDILLLKWLNSKNL
ncbi:hypothetical protein [Akkermansia sp.]